MEDSRQILFFDGECVMCNGVVKKLFALDRDARFEFASLQGEKATELRAQNDEFPEGLETFVLWDDGEIYLRSRAAFRAARLLPAPWRWLSVFRFLPRFLTDAAYRFVARNRVKWFGRTEACWLPPAEHTHRFLT